MTMAEPRDTAELIEILSHLPNGTFRLIWKMTQMENPESWLPRSLFETRGTVVGCAEKLGLIESKGDSTGPLKDRFLRLMPGVYFAMRYFPKSVPRSRRGRPHEEPRNE